MKWIGVRFAVALVAVFSLASAATAQPGPGLPSGVVPIGDWQQLGTGSDPVAIALPAADPLSEPEVLLAWADESGIWVRRLMSDGRPAEEGRLVVESGPSFLVDRPRLAALEAGVLLLWRETLDAGPISAPPNIRGRLLDETGQVIDGSVAGLLTITPRGGSDAAAVGLPDGGFAVAWQAIDPSSGVRVYLRRFDASGAPLSEEVEVDQAGEPGRIGPAIAYDPVTDELAVAWAEAPSSPRGEGELMARRFDRQAQPKGAGVAGRYGVTQLTLTRAPSDGGGFNVFDVYDLFFAPITPPPTGYLVERARFDAAGFDSALPESLGLNLSIRSHPASLSAAVDHVGSTMVSWAGASEVEADRIRVAAVGPSGAQLGSPLLLPLGQGEVALDSALVAVGRTAQLVPSSFLLLAQEVADGVPVLLARRIEIYPGGSCVESEQSLCLLNGRFEVTLRWRRPNGATARADALALSDRSGAFWFYRQGLIEAGVKVVDGRSINGNFWVFFGSLTDSAFDLVVRDTVIGTVEVYSNSNRHGRLASGADLTSFSDIPPPPLADRGLVPDGLVPDGLALAEALLGDRAAPAGIGTLSPPPPGCAATATAFCLLGRFRVEAVWRHPVAGDERPATVLPGAAPGPVVRSGAFRFGAPANLELLIKLVDGRPVNGHHWLFLGSLSNFEYRVTVTDTETGETRTYTNPAGRLRGRTDFELF